MHGRRRLLREERRYHFSRSTSSTLIVLRCRKTSSTIARPTPTSAAATVMMKRAKICPTAAVSLNQALNAIKLIFTEFSISSIDIRTSTAFLRASTPYTPTLKRNALSVRIQARLTCRLPSILLRQHDRAYQCGKQQDRDQLERQDVPAEQRLPDVGSANDLVQVDALAAEGAPDDKREDAEHRSR